MKLSSDSDQNVGSRSASRPAYDRDAWEFVGAFRGCVRERFRESVRNEGSADVGAGFVKERGNQIWHFRVSTASELLGFTVLGNSIRGFSLGFRV